MTRTLQLAGLLAALAAAGCAEQPPAGPPPATVVEGADRPADKALAAGLQAYDNGRYAEAESQLDRALRAGLAAPRDRAAAHKVLAFIYCTSNRTKACEAAFRAARQADPSFALGKSEAGHPLWGPVYRRTLP